MKFIFPLLFLTAIVACNNETKNESDKVNPDWALLPFSKVDSVNPVLLPGLSC